MATIRKDIEAGDDLEQLKAQVAEQQQRLEMLETRQDPPPDGGGTKKDKLATRRQLLRLAGATLVGAAGSAALRAIPASANNGQAMVVGTIATQDLNNVTGLTLTGTANPARAFKVVAETFAGMTAIAGYGTYAGVYGHTVSGRGVYGYAYTANGIGVKGGGDFGVQGFGYSYYGNFHTGVFGAGSSIGVLGQSINGIGVKAVTSQQSGQALYAYTGATGAIGVEGNSTRGPGAVLLGATGWVGAVVEGDLGVRAFASGAFPAVEASSLGGGPDAQLRGTGRLNQRPNIAGGVGAPNFTPTAGYFEMVRATDGAMWVNRGTGLLKASWKRVNAVRADSADGAGTAYKPLRLIDTRNTTGAGGQATLGPAVNATVRRYQVAGIPGAVIAQNIPTDAVAVFGNLTAVGGAQGGFMAIYPAGAAYNPASDPATFNFSANGVTSNGFFCGLGTGTFAGKLEVYIGVYGVSAANLIIDITGYVQ